MNEDQMVVLDIFKEWFEEEDASLLIAEDVVVRVDPVGETIKGVTPWIKDTPSSIVRLIKATRCPFGLMKLCTTDMLIASAQEAERLYERGVSMTSDCPPKYFNYVRTQLSSDPLILLVRRILRQLEEKSINLQWKGISRLVELSFAKLGLAKINRLKRNKLIVEACYSTNYDVNLRYFYQKHHYKCIKLPYESGIVMELKPEFEARVINQATANCTLDGMSVILVSI
jgi:hypothetical protein